MAIFKQRIPSREALVLLFVACMIPVHVWSIFNVLREVPAWILRMSIWELLGVMAYTQAFALFETTVIVLLFLIAAFILPGRLLRDNLVLFSAIIMLLLSLWLIVLHYNESWIAAKNIRILAVWGLSLLIALILFLWASKKWQPLETSVFKALSALTVLAALYLVIDAFSILIILLRNIFS